MTGRVSLITAVSIVALCAATIAAPTESVAKRRREARLLDILLERSIITEEEYAELLEIAFEEEASAVEVRRPSLDAKVESVLLANEEEKDETRVGYDKGFVISEGSFSLKINGQLQVLYQFDDFDHDRSSQDRSSFSIPRARLIFSGSAFDPNLKYRFQFNISSSPILKDAYLDYDFPGIPIAIRAGQFKIPFALQNLISSRDLEFIKRSITVDALAPVRDIGMMIHGETDQNVFSYGIGVFNGNGENASNDGDQMMGVGRVQVSPTGHATLSEGDMSVSKDLALLLGAAYLYNPMGDSNFTGDDVDTSEFTIDGLAVFQGFFLEAAYFNGFSNPQAAGVRDTDFWGWYGQAGYFFVPEKFEVAFRYSMYNVDGSPELLPRGVARVDTDYTELSVAVNWYFHKHNHRLTFQYSNLEEDPDSGTDFRDNLIALQWQLAF